MKRFLLLLLGITLSGCTVLENFSLRPKPDEAPAVNAEEATAVESDVNNGFYSPSEMQLEEALGLHQDALDSAATGNYPAAQNLFENAIISMTSLRMDSLSIMSEELEWLRWQLIEDYAAFLDKLPELPAESSPSTVYISLSEFLGDSIASPGELISRVLPTEGEPTQADSLIYPQLYPDVPLMVNSYVERVLKFYRTKGRKVFTKWLSRAGEAIPYYTALLREEGLPEELVYLSMIESGFSTRAYSRAHASGPWQFISSTARIYDLEVDYWYDERRDPEKSTRAASAYLKKLYDEFGDWYLAFAAYNSGEGRVHRAMRRSGKKDFWGIRRYLPRQTREYVPSYLAARIICQDPASYGFDPIDLKPSSIPESETAYVDGCVGLKDIAKCAGTTEAQIKLLNPALKRGCTPPSGKNFPVLIPLGAGETFSEKITHAPRLERTEWVRHRIRRGEALSTIAAKYGVSMRSIMEIPANNLKSPNRIRAGRYLLIPIGNAPASSSRNYASKSNSRSTVIPEGRAKSTYRVRKGDTLSDIAQKFGVSIADLKNWNSLWGKRFIYPGQTLTVWTKKPAEPPELFATVGPIPPESLKTTPQVHVVQPGDTLWDISRLYGVSISNLKKWNNVYSVRRLMPGTQLRLTP